MRCRAAGRWPNGRAAAAALLPRGRQPLIRRHGALRRQISNTEGADLEHIEALPVLHCSYVNST